MNPFTRTKVRPTTHDFGPGKRYLGHDYIFKPVDDGRRACLTVWSGGELRRGDFLILEHPKGGDSRYRVTSAERIHALASDPPPMWRVDAEFAPRGQSR